MKKLLIILTLFSIILCGCTQAENKPVTPTNKPTNTPTPTEALIKEDRYGTKYIAKELPYECPYNNTSFTLKEVKYISAKSGKSNELIVLAILDVANIPDGDDFDWFSEDLGYPSVFDNVLDKPNKNELTSVALTNEKNDLDAYRMNLDCKLHYTDTKELYCFFTTVFLDDCRYPFEDCNISLAISTRQEEKDSSGNHKINRVIYTEDITKDDIEPLSEQTESIRNFIAKKISSNWK
jgi:hypothetical protein